MAGKMPGKSTGKKSAADSHSTPARHSASALLTNHVRCWVWGRHAVLETLRAGRWPVQQVLVAEEVERAVQSEVVALGQTWRVPVSVMTSQEIAGRCRNREHQGLAAQLGPFPYRDARELVPLALQPGGVLLLDRLQDAFNFGALVRCASVLGMAGVVVGKPQQAEVGSQVVRSSAGAVNHIPIVQVESMVQAAVELRAAGVTLIAATEKGTTEAGQSPLPSASALVIGNEGQGISTELLELCRLQLSIPMAGQVGSLNAAVAGGILMYELLRQRRERKPTT